MLRGTRNYIPYDEGLQRRLQENNYQRRHERHGFCARTLRSVIALEACQGVHSRCWECECGDVCGVGEKYMRLLREEMRKRGTEWTGYDTAAAIIAQEELQRATAHARSIEAEAAQRRREEQRLRQQGSYGKRDTLLVNGRARRAQKNR